jgi:hypothetical protein
MLAIKGGQHWLVLTNQRLLLYVANLRDKRLAHACPLSELDAAQVLNKEEVAWWQKLQLRLSAFGAVVRFGFRDGTIITGFAISGQTARCIVARLQARTADTQPDGKFCRPSALPEAVVAPGLSGEAKAQILASLLIPGLGQWMQRRSGTALILFLIWIVMAWGAARVGWTLWHSLAAVPPWYVYQAVGFYLFVCMVAAWEAWRMRERQP